MSVVVFLEKSEIDIEFSQSINVYFTAHDRTSAPFSTSVSFDYYQLSVAIKPTDINLTSNKM